MKMSEEEKEEMTDWLIAREECVEEDKKEETDLTVVYLKGYADAEEKYRDKIKKLEEENRLQRSQLNSAFNNGFIPKQKVKDKINKYIDQKLVELTKTGSYIQNAGTPEQERLNGMQRGVKDIKKILLEDK